MSTTLSDVTNFTTNDPVFAEQEGHLKRIPKEEWQRLHQLFEAIPRSSNGDEFVDTDAFRYLHQSLYNLKLIFNFNWMEWESGRKNFRDKTFDYAGCSLLELSMYLTAIFRRIGFATERLSTISGMGQLKRFSMLLLGSAVYSKVVLPS